MYILFNLQRQLSLTLKKTRTKTIDEKVSKKSNDDSH